MKVEGRVSNIDKPQESTQGEQEDEKREPGARSRKRRGTHSEIAAADGG
jgi:hypothetical protein